MSRGSLLLAMGVACVCLLACGLVPVQAGQADRPRYGYLAPEPSGPVNFVGVRNRTIRGLRIAADRSVTLTDCHNLTVISCDLRSVRLVNCSNIVIANSHLHDSPNVAVEIDGCTDVLVQGNRIERVASGVYAHQSQGVRVIGNYVQDVRGPAPRGQMVQFDKVVGPGNVIAHNYARNLRYRSRPEDAINLFQSSGTPASPILITRNYLTGDPQLGSAGMSPSGSGIMLGDAGGSYILCTRNTLVSPGQAGIGVAGGEFIRVEDNTIVGKRSDVSNVGLYVWNQANAPGGSVSVVRNRVSWINQQGRPNPFWNGGGFHPVTVADNQFDSSVTALQLPSPPSVAPWPPLPYGQRPVYPFRAR